MSYSILLDPQGLRGTQGQGGGCGPARWAAQCPPGAVCTLMSPAPSLLVTQGRVHSGGTQTELVPRREFWDKVPGTQAEVFVSVQGAGGARVAIGGSSGSQVAQATPQVTPPAHPTGDILGETILGSLTATEVTSLLTVPDGCPEQTLSRLAPVVILTGYLDATGQWGAVGVEHRSQVLKNLFSGEAGPSGDPQAQGTPREAPR